MRRIISVIATLCLATVTVVHGQAAGSARPETPAAGGDRKKDLEDAAEKLRKAKDSMDLEKAREAAEGVLK